MSQGPSEIRRAHVSIQTTQPKAFGHGWISGVLSVLLGVIGLGAVLCFLFPSYAARKSARPDCVKAAGE